MKPFGEALRLGTMTAALVLCPVLATGDETEQMMNGAPNQDATLRDKNAAAGAPVGDADPRMVKPPPKKTDGEMVAKPPKSASDPGIHVPGASPSETPTVKK